VSATVDQVKRAAIFQEPLPLNMYEVRALASEIKMLERNAEKAGNAPADTLRLNWLQSQPSYSLSNLGGLPTHHLYVSSGTESVRTVRTATQGSLREAIDALMATDAPPSHTPQVIADILEEALERAFDAGASNNTMPGWEGIEALAKNTEAEVLGALSVRMPV
jgi:hypothetical protein